VKEKELRLALVCYGGVSLAVYMHGITKEILKLVRASKDYHNGPGVRGRNEYVEVAPDRGDETDTEPVYFDLLKEIGERLDLRVIVDIIAGTSAGGVNGIILARALAHDLRIDPIRSFWLTHSDVADLMPEHKKAGPLRKWYLRPVIWYFMWRHRKDLGGHKDMKHKLSMFLRSRWFTPPFEGLHLSDVLFEGFSSMGEPPKPRESLLPPGQSLDLMVTLTDFHGFTKTTPIHNPPEISEREHRHVMHLSYRQSLSHEEVSDFDGDNIPALAFAARATSSFPGAFPPAQLGEVDTLLHRKGLDWKKRVDFLYDNFYPYMMAGINPAEASFIDGSVLNNKPFAQAIAAISGRPAYRHVDRRVLYIEPHPENSRNSNWGKVPGFFGTLKGALSDIPRHEPIHDDLTSVITFNDRVGRLQSIIEAVRPQIQAMVNIVAGPSLEDIRTAPEIAALRHAANEMVAKQTGFAYESYLRLKLDNVLERTQESVIRVCGYNKDSNQARRVRLLLSAWADQKKVSAAAADVMPVQSDSHSPLRDRPWIDFLMKFDTHYRRRRLHFVIRALNRLYEHLNEKVFRDLKSENLDAMKSSFYNVLSILQSDNGKGAQRKSANSDLKSTFHELVAMDLPIHNNQISVSENVIGLVDNGLDLLAADLSLSALDDMTDEILAVRIQETLPTAARREILEHYLGFPVWDVLAFPITNWQDLGEFDEIRIDRLSPDDSNTLRSGGAESCLKGIQFHHFGAFFSKEYRENDFLWGRIHAAERLIDIVVDAARLEGAAHNIDILNLKKRALCNILETERPHLPACNDLIDDLLKEVDRLSEDPD